MQIVLGTSNPNKVREINEMISGTGVEFILPPEGFDPIEDGETFEENSLIKAQAAWEISRNWALADDSGLCVDALKGAPGIHSARYCGEWGKDQENNDKLLEALKHVPEGQRQAHYYVALAYVRHAEDPVPIIVTASWEGAIGLTPRGSNGFGYDPLFQVTGRDLTAAQLPPQIKNCISHRARALALLAAEFRRCHEI